MPPTRRELLAGLGAGAAVGLAGCAGQLTDDGVAFGATEATLSASVQEETGYTHFRTTPDTVSREFQRFGFSRSVDVTNVISEYDRAIELSLLGTRLQAAVFATLSTPQVQILGRSFNPIEEISTAEITTTIQQQYDQIENVTEDRQHDMDVAGQSTTVTRFTATARLIEAGFGVDIYLYVSEAVMVGEDFLVTLAAHPQAFGANVETISTLNAALTHAP
ncbi:MAG: hypothetical protein ACI8UR_001146 [Natronomonas sp.]|jgi:hypothetical protein|uniref:DUF6517 family protein n=1 Tax=Natronomonas sp. TaxID=2184060 RepID=UPI0039897B24